jgi:hypothetical protein
VQSLGYLSYFGDTAEIAGYIIGLCAVMKFIFVVIIGMFACGSETKASRDRLVFGLKLFMFQAVVCSVAWVYIAATVNFG